MSTKKPMILVLAGPNGSGKVLLPNSLMLLANILMLMIL